MLKYIIAGTIIILSHTLVASDTKFNIVKIAQDPGNVTNRLLFIFKPSFKKAQIPVKACVDVLAQNKECQNYTAGEGKIDIQPFGGEDYTHAGIKIYDKGYKLLGCESHKDGFCVFNSSTKSSKILKLVKLSK